MQNFKFRFGLEDNVYFYNYNVEVDFVVPDKSMAIQVCYDLGNDASETYLREIKALVNIAKRLQYTDLYIITYNEEREIVTDGMYINVVPAHKWLFNLRKS
jgi:predicted AAA+ superfamily ATPase